MTAPLTKTEILSEMARIEMSRRCWPGLDGDEEEWAQGRLSDLRADLAEIEDAEVSVSSDRRAA
jgi:hypothetical protein